MNLDVGAWLPGHDMAFALLLSLVIQAVFFTVAASLKTDKVTDLSYGLTFMLMAVALWWRRGQPDGPALVLMLMVVLWGIRLAGYLLQRIVRIGRDARFDGVREHFWPFFKFWLFQGLAVWAIMLPVIVGAPNTDRWSVIGAAAVAIWAVGLVIETIADAQKFRFKNTPAGRHHWPDLGLWRFSRHPNYFGELLCWWGVWLFVLPELANRPVDALIALAGPLTITALLLWATGIPTLEASARKKWGDDPAYAEYRRRTRLLVPLPKFR